MYVQFARITPSLLWDDVAAHVQTDGSATRAVFDAPTRHKAPSEPRPVPLDYRKLPDAGAMLARLVAAFPKGYAEAYTTYERGCHQLLTLTPEIRTTECGVLLPVEHRTD